jgi:hypothetical protein
VLDRLFHPQGVDLVHIDAAADGADQCQRELAAQMLAEFLQPAKQFVRVCEGGSLSGSPKSRRQSQHPVGIGEPADPA